MEEKSQKRKKIWIVVKRAINQSPKKGAAILVAQKSATKVIQVVA